jgi:HlyD family secretion protein
VWAVLGDGFRVEASIVIWEKDDVVRLPVSAAFKHDEKWTVFVVEGDTARLRHVDLGEQNGVNAQILRGIHPGERVILHPGERISDGASVRPR